MDLNLAAYQTDLSSERAVCLPCRQTAGGAVADLEEGFLEVCRGEKRPMFLRIKTLYDGSWQHKEEGSDSPFISKNVLQGILTVQIYTH